jgi:hypothetical protein
VRSLSGSLQAAQRSTSRRPYLRVLASDRFANVRRLRPTSWYTGSEVEGPHAAVCGNDNSLNRLRIEANTLYHSRVTSPGSGSTYSSWTSFRTVTRLCAITRFNAEVVAYAVDNATPTQVYTNGSLDNGATWSGWVLAFTHTATVEHIAAATTPGGTQLCAVVSGGQIHVRKRTAGAWGGASTLTDAAHTVVTCGMDHSGDWHIIYTATVTATGNKVVRQVIHGDGFEIGIGTWGTPTTLAEYAASASITPSWPFIDKPDVNRLTYRLQFTGATAYDRTFHSNQTPSGLFSQSLWREPAPTAVDSDYGLALSVNSSHLFLTSARHVLALALADNQVDITADVLAATLRYDPESPRASALVLNNRAGTYDTLPAPLSKGCQIAVSPGYYNSSGVAEYSSGGPLWWVEDVVHDFTNNPHTVTLVLAPLARWLQRWTAPRPYKQTAVVSQILTSLFARVGFEFAGSGASSLSSSLSLPLAFPAGRDGLAAVRSLLARIPDVLETAGEFGFINEPLAGDTPAETFAWQTASTHPVAAARYSDALRPSAHIRVIGGAAADQVGEALYIGEAELAYASPDPTADRQLSAVQAGTVAAGIARKYEIAQRDDLLIAPVHCGLEANDVIAVTDARIGLSAAPRRVKRFTLHYTRGPRGKARYDHEIALGNP